MPVNDPDRARYIETTRSGGPPRAQWVTNSTIAYLDYIDGVANVWMRDIHGGPARQVTYFDSGFLFAYDFSRDGRRIVLSHAEDVSDMVLIRDFR